MDKSSPTPNLVRFSPPSSQFFLSLSSPHTFSIPTSNSPFTHPLSPSFNPSLTPSFILPYTFLKTMAFVKEGQKKPTQEPCSNSSYLNSANDWQVKVDLRGKLKIPSSITITDLRPDMIIVSESTKQLGIIELTVPNENRIEVSSEIKKAKYAPLAEEAKQKGWRVRIWAVEVGCKGFPARSLTVLFRDMGYTGRERKELLRRIGDVAEEASRAIWRWSSIKEWGKG